MIRFIFVLIICFLIGLALQNYAAPVDPSITEYTFGSGFLHGVGWLCLLLVKWYGYQIVVFADFYTWGYLIGFVIGVIVSIILLSAALFAS